MRDNDPSNEKTMFDDGEDDSANDERTQLHQEDSTPVPPARHEATQVIPPGGRASHASPAHVSSTEHQPFKWDSAVSEPALRAKAYYSDSSPISKLMTTPSLIMAGFGLVIGFLVGYWLRGFSHDLQQPISSDVQMRETLSSTTAEPTADEAVPPPTMPAEKTAEAPPVTEKPAPPPVTKSAKKTVENKKPWVRSIKISTQNRQSLVDIDVDGHPFKYTSRLLKKPLSLRLEIMGLTGSYSKSVVVAPSRAKPVSKVRLQKQSDRLIVNIDLTGKNAANYNIQRSKSGVRVSFSQAKR